MDPQKMQEMLAELWKQHLSTILERVELLEHAQRSLAKGTLSREQWQEATGAAHKLAGVLGTFQRGEGTEVARRIENWPIDANGLPESPEKLKAEIACLRLMIS